MKISKQIIKATVPDRSKVLQTIRDMQSGSFAKGTELSMEPPLPIYRDKVRVRLVELGNGNIPLERFLAWLHSRSLEPGTVETLIACAGWNDDGQVFIAPGSLFTSKKGGHYLPIRGWDEGINVDDRVYSFIDMKVTWDSKKTKWISQKTPLELNSLCYSFPYREAAWGKHFYLCIEP